MLSYRAGRYNGVLEDCEIESFSMVSSFSSCLCQVLEDCERIIVNGQTSSLCKNKKASI